MVHGEGLYYSGCRRLSLHCDSPVWMRCRMRRLSSVMRRSSLARVARFSDLPYDHAVLTLSTPPFLVMMSDILVSSRRFSCSMRA